MTSYTIAALYQFVTLDDFQDLRHPLKKLCVSQGVKGTLLLANEGINGTIAGPQAGIDAVLDFLKQDGRFTNLELKFSYTDHMPFLRMKVRLKKEIVTLGVEGTSPTKSAGTYIDPRAWNALISDPEVILIDTRNDYEYEIGTFKGAINPHTETFRELPEFVAKTLDKNKDTKVAMFCTGGIRCEKSTAYLKDLGFDNVYHLKGGILQYLEDVPQAESLWEGECFVFDNRVAVKHGLEQGSYDQCHCCRYPVSAADKESPKYVPGISCPRCYTTASENQRRRATARQTQIDIAKAKNIAHLGPEAMVS